jgi:CBS domain-containing protein
MRVAEIMNTQVRVVSPDDTIASVAHHMAENDVGFLVVAQAGRLVGVITDRDIVVRCVADGREGATAVAEIMTPDVEFCFDDEEVSAATQRMRDIQVSRLPVINRGEGLVGAVSLADAARANPLFGDAGF